MRKDKKIFLLIAFVVFIALALIPLGTLAQSSTATTSPSSACGLVSSQLSSLINTQEPWYCPINQQIYGQWANALPLAMIAVLVSFLIASLLFMAGIALNSNRIRNYGIGEFYEAAASAIIVGAFMYLCAVLFGVLPFTYVGNINPYPTALNLITTTISTAQQLYTSLFNSYLSLTFITSPAIRLEVLGASDNGLAQLFVNVYTVPVTIFFIDPANAISAFLSDGILILYAEYYLIVFFSMAAIPAFLVPGIIFRAILPTRALGGILIALAIGFYLVMPLLFAVAFYFTAPSIQTSMALAAAQMARFGNGSPSAAASAQGPAVIGLMNVKSSLSGFWLLILFYPSLIIVITYTSVQEISRFIGTVTGAGSSRGLRRFI